MAPSVLGAGLATVLGAALTGAFDTAPGAAPVPLLDAVLAAAGALSAAYHSSAGLRRSVARLDARALVGAHCSR